MRILASLCVLSFGCFVGAGEPLLQVPSGFAIQRVAGPPAINFPMFASLDERGRLYLTESSGNDLYAELQKQVRKCRISLLEDRDGDGLYEIAHVFADNLAPSMGLAWREGTLFAADPPDLITLQDTDGDGRADKRSVLLTGFGHSDNGSLHGLTFGPDGWLYFTMGNPDGYDLRGPDGSRAWGKTGALIRCRPNGSRVETVARGFENLVEIAFMPDGSIIGTVNWYQLPDRGIRDALVQILEGGRFPLHSEDPTVPHFVSDTVLPPLTLFPAVAHSGLMIYRSGTFPLEMRDNLFSAQHNTRKIARHKLTPKGASFSVETFDFVTTDDPDVHFSDVLEDKDGTLLLVDTGSWYVQHCPTGRIRQAPARGGIYRVSFSRSSSPSPPSRRAEAPRRLVEERDGERRPSSAFRATNQAAIAAAARDAGRRSETNSAPELIALLRSPSLGLRLAAAEALAHCGSRASVPALLQALAGDADEFLEHALTFALYHLADTNTLISALDHPSVKVQRAALLLLDQPPFQAAPERAVVARLNSSDARLQATARWILLRHPEWGEAGAVFLRQLIERPSQTQTDTQDLGRFLPLFQTNTMVISSTASSLAVTNHQVTEAQRVALLEALATLEFAQAPAQLAGAVLELLRSESPAVRLQAIRAAGALRIARAEEQFISIAHDPDQPATLRVEALRELIRRRRRLVAVEMDFLLGQLAATDRPSSRLAAVETLISAKLTAPQMAAFLNAVRRDPMISPAPILAGVQRNGLHPEYAVALLDYLAASLDAGWTISASELKKVVAGVPEAQRVRAKRLLTGLEQNIARQRQQLAEFEPLLKGGDYVRGEKIFFEKAQCTACHQVWGNGGRVGPDLTSIGSIRAGHDILESLVLPSATIAQGYDTLNVTTKDGETYTGVRVGKADNPLVLRDASGREMILHQAQIQGVEQSKVSLMPENLLNNLTRDEVCDLLTYLQHLK